MENSIPSIADVQAALLHLSYSQIGTLSRLSGVPLTTLWKVRVGNTLNPGIETVRRFMPYITAAAT